MTLQSTLSVPLITGLHHASVLVRDLERSLAFYCGVLGLTIDCQRPDLGYPGAWLNVGDNQIHLLQLPNPDPISGRPVHIGHDRHVALKTTNIAQLQIALQAAQLPYTQSRSRRHALFCRDPDGNGLEFIDQSDKVSDTR
ncbi:MAG: VOC family protein [Gammaproteobacteria bacterium]